MSAEVPTPPNQDPSSGYDRDAIVASITRYYELLSKMVAIKPVDVAYPHKGRRPDSKIPLSKLRRLGFNDRMIDFVRHVPFVLNSVRPVFPYTETLVYYHSVFDDYADEDYLLEDPSRAYMWPIPDVRMSEGVLPLSRPGEVPSLGTWWMLDTNNGELTPHGPHITRPPEEVPEDEEWRSSRPVPATAYFDGLCEDLKSLKMIPLPGDPSSLYWDMWECPPDNTNPGDRNFLTWANEAKEIYRQCHWPDLRYFQRAKCRRLLIDLRKRFKAYELEGKAMPPRPPASTEDAEESVPTPPILEPESYRSAPWGVEKIVLQTDQEGVFVNTTLKI